MNKIKSLVTKEDTQEFEECSRCCLFPEPGDDFDYVLEGLDDE